MDTLYIGDIPLDYKYAQFSNGYITLFNKPYGNNETLDYYRIYTNNNGFYYSHGTQNFGSYNTTYFQEVEVSDNFLYRTDIDGIFTVTFIFIVFGIWLLNLITSFVHKGGVLSGLL